MSGYINMSKKAVFLLLLPLLLASCGEKHSSFEDVKAKVDTIEYAPKYPIYRVVGALDFNGETIFVDEEFFNDPSPDSFVPYARYNEGFYCPSSSANEKSVYTDYGEDEVKVYMMASRSYWLRAPMRITKENYYSTYPNSSEENKTCAHYILEHIITSFVGSEGAINPSWNKMYYEVTENGFAFGGEGVHTIVKIDNYPFYPDYESHKEIGPWNKLINPLPCYKNEVNLKANIRFEYNSDGWLIKESLSSDGYDPTAISRSQVSLVSEYTYKFN